MSSTKIRNCQLVDIPTKTHTIHLASLKDLPNAQEIVDNFLNMFQIVKVSPITGTEVEQPKPTIRKESAYRRVPLNAVATFLKVKDILREEFTAKEYDEALKTVGIEYHTSYIYNLLEVISKSGKIELIRTGGRKRYRKIHREDISGVANSVRENRSAIADTMR